jgi:hypothetical protein
VAQLPDRSELHWERFRLNRKVKTKDEDSKAEEKAEIEGQWRVYTMAVTWSTEAAGSQARASRRDKN